MDFDLTPEQEMWRRTIREFAQREITPLIDESEEKEKFPVEIIPKMASLGYLGAAYPPEYGGSAPDDLSIRNINECIWFEEMSRVSAGIAFGIQAAAVGAPNYILRDYGSEEQKQKYLVPCITKGERLGAFAMTESEAGSDPASMKTTATKKDSTYILNGSKFFISGGNIADFVTVAAYTDKSKGTRGGISLFIVEKGTPGFEIGQKFVKIGHRAAENVELLFADCPVPKENLVGEEGRGWYQLMGALNESRVGDSARAVGLARAAYEVALRYAKERVQFGQPIINFQGVSFKLAEMHMRIEAARLLTYNGAYALGKKADARLEVSTARLCAAETAREVTTKAMQTLGGYSYMMDSPLQRYWRDSYLFYFGYGTEEIQKVIISEAIGR
jgi:alkylation response protein AidB-like acyl-CoA dehydrogenase